MSSSEESWLRQRAVPEAESPPSLGASERVRSTDVLAALRQPRSGIVYDLDPGRWSGMPVLDSHPPFTTTSYRTPHGLRLQGDLAAFADGPTTFASELIVTSMHTGAHIDALSHVAHGEEDRIHGGQRSAEAIGDFGARVADATALPPFLCRGVLVDVPAARGIDTLGAGEAIGWEETVATLERQGVALREGDAVLFRTGYMAHWGLDGERAAASYGAGIDVECAAQLAAAGAIAVGADTEGCEQTPAPGDDPLPAHVELMVRNGVHILELLYLEDLAADGVHEFLFLCLPLRVRGATGSMVRPVAVA